MVVAMEQFLRAKSINRFSQAFCVSLLASSWSLSSARWLGPSLWTVEVRGARVDTVVPHRPTGGHGN